MTGHRGTHELAGRLQIVAAALLWSSSGLFVKSDVFSDWPDTSRGAMLACWRALFAGLVMAPLIRRPRWSGLLVPLTLSFAAMSLSYLSAVVLTTAANAIWLQATSPWWVLALSIVFLHDRARGREWIPLGFAGLGVGLILACEVLPELIGFGEASTAPARWGVMLGLASGLFFGCVAVLMRQLREMESAWLVTLVHLATFVLMLPWLAAQGVWPTPVQWGVLALFGVVQMAMPYMLFTRGLREVGAQEGVVIGLIEPVLMPIWVFLARQETPRWWTIVGASLILLGLVLRYGVLELLDRARK
jgi:drug/metabolite transporter, DME family